MYLKFILKLKIYWQSIWKKSPWHCKYFNIWNCCSQKQLF